MPTPEPNEALIAVVTSKLSHSSVIPGATFQIPWVQNSPTQSSQATGCWAFHTSVAVDGAVLLADASLPCFLQCPQSNYVNPQLHQSCPQVAGLIFGKSVGFKLGSCGTLQSLLFQQIACENVIATAKRECQQ